MATSDHLLTTIEEPIGWLVVDRPESRGALTQEMWLALPGKLATLAATEGVRAAVVRGRGGSFIAGADIGEFRRVRADPELARRYDRGAVATLETLADLPVPAIAMIEGACIGGGCLVAFACDLRIAAKSATFAIPAGRLGLAYPYPALERIVDLVGEARAVDLLLTGRTLTASQALELGFVHYVVEPSELEAETRRLAERVAANAPLAMRYIRLALRRASRSRLPREEIERLADACFASEDYAEGIAAFFAKRRPVFKGL